jgi:hypothetical protein
MQAILLLWASYLLLNIETVTHQLARRRQIFIVSPPFLFIHSNCLVIIIFGSATVLAKFFT